MRTRVTVGRCLGGSAKYKWLVLKIQEYPINLALLELAESGIKPPCSAVREARGAGYVSRPTERKAIEIAELKKRITEVELALSVVPEEYRNGVLYHTINYGSKSSGRGRGSSWREDRYDFAHRNTWKKWKTKFLLEYAAIIGEMDHINLLVEYEDILFAKAVDPEKVYHF